MSEHTAGRLEVGCRNCSGKSVSVCGPGGIGAIASCHTAAGGTPEEKEANARHIVACWNACEDINPKAVPALLKAAKAVLCEFLGDSDECTSPECSLCALATAIAKAEETHE